MTRRAAQVRAPLAFGEVAQRDVGVGVDQVSVDQGRHQPERMNLEIFGWLVAQRDLSALVIESELSQPEAHLVGVGGCPVVVQNDLARGFALAATTAAGSADAPVQHRRDEVRVKACDSKTPAGTSAQYARRLFVTGRRCCHVVL
jgi:hypothetical protein